MSCVTRFLIWLAGIAVSLALDVPAAVGQYLINNATNSLLTINGIWYSVSNSTTDVYKMDPLIDGKACTRDAALMQLLGINTIYIASLDASQNHDACFSIFNAVGIYVVIVLRGDGAAFNKDPYASYTTDLMKGTFEVIDAIKDYENLLAIDIGNFPQIDFAAADSFADAMLLFRTVIRDTKEYISKNSDNAILTGGSLPYQGGYANLAGSLFDYFQCAIDNSTDDISRTDYIGWETAPLIEPGGDATKAANDSWAGLLDELNDCSVPIWLSIYETIVVGNQTYDVTVGALNDTALLYNLSRTWELLEPNGLLNGGARWQWANVGVNNQVPANLVVLDADGNIQLTARYDRLKDILSNLNTEAFLSGQNLAGLLPYDIHTNPPACEKNLLANTTIDYGAGTTFTLATQWSMPTRPAGLDAVITTGARGTRGQMIDVTITDIAYNVRDSSGNFLTDVFLSPSKSSTRTTTRAATGAATGTLDGTATVTPGPALSTGAKAGIGVGVTVGALALVGAGLFWFLKRRSKTKADTKAGTGARDGMGGVREKPELSAESNGVAELREDGRMMARMEGPPAELMAFETPQELSGTDVRRRDMGPL